MVRLTLISIAVLVVLGIVLWAVGLWNHLIRLRNQVRHGFAGIDVLLAQRRDELPALVATCKGAMRHERETLERVMELRAEATTPAGAPVDLTTRLQIENELTFCMDRVFARVEAYPELASLELMGELSRRITELEDRIADRRELFNDATTHYNEGVSQFPGVLFAAVLGYRPLPLLEASTAESAQPPVLQLT